MFDRATCRAASSRWDAWQRDAEVSPGAFADLSEVPGPDLAGALSQWEPDSRGDDELIDRIGGWEKVKAWVEAGQLAEIAELAARRRHTDELERADHATRGGQGEPGQLMEFVGDEIALAARISRVAASHKLDLAHDLTEVLPAVFAALRAGEIDLIRARIIAEGTRGLDPEVRVAVADQVLSKAPGQTSSALRSAVARAVHIIDPAGVEERHTADLTRRRVILTPRENGMSELWAFLPADGAAAIMATLHRLAEASHTPSDRAARDQRSADQRRADALIDLATSYLDTHPGLHPQRSTCRRPAGRRRPRPTNESDPPAPGLGPSPSRAARQPLDRTRPRTRRTRRLRTDPHLDGLPDRG